MNSFSVEGLSDPRDPNIEYMGNATLQPSGKYHAVANIYGALALIQLTVTFEGDEIHIECGDLPGHLPSKRNNRVTIKNPNNV